LHSAFVHFYGFFTVCVDMHALTLSTKSKDNRPSRHLYIIPKPRRSSVILMLTIFDVSPIDTHVSHPITWDQYLIPCQFRGPVSHISPLKWHYELISRIWLNRYINIDAITMEWWDQPIGSFIGLRSTFGLGIIDPCDIADRCFSIPLGSVSGLTLQCFILYLFLLLLPWETRHYLYSLP